MSYNGFIWLNMIASTLPHLLKLPQTNPLKPYKKKRERINPLPLIVRRSTSDCRLVVLECSLV